MSADQAKLLAVVVLSGLAMVFIVVTLVRDLLAAGRDADPYPTRVVSRPRRSDELDPGEERSEGVIP